MSSLHKIAYFQNRRDETPNQELAKELATTHNTTDIHEIAEHLWNENTQIQSDCLKVLYEIGYIQPTLITPYSSDFLKLLKSKNNRIIWGSMIALATIADLQAAEIYQYYDDIRRVMEKGSVITVDNGVKTLAHIAASDETRRQNIIPYLLRHLETCRSKDVPHHAEQTLIAINADHKTNFIAVIAARIPELTRPQAARIQRVIKEAENR